MLAMLPVPQMSPRPAATPFFTTPAFGLWFFNLIFPLLIWFAVRTTFYALKTYGSA